MQTVLQFSDEAQHFSGTSKVNIKKEVANSFKSTFKKPGNFNKSYNGKKSECPMCWGEPHGEMSSTSTSKKLNLCGKKGHFAKKVSK